MARKRSGEGVGLEPAPAATAATLTVVGIGASAGGLEAVGRVLAALPPKPGMAIVIVQHLDPHQQSLLPELLRRTTSIPVHEAADGKHWEEDHVYVMPPNVEIKLVDGLLRLSPRPPGRHLPVDEFLQSIAADAKVKAIGVVLSGTGTDGTKGLQAIKASGGLTFAQDSRSAKFDGMPRHAVLAGCVDFVLTPEEIARELVRVGQHPYWFHHESLPATESPDQVEAVLEILHRATGVDFSFYKRSTLERRILRRVVLHRMDGLDQYLRRLREDPDEARALFDDVLIHVTSFFRDPGLGEILKDKVFPRLFQNRPSDRPIRVWVPGCSTGEEVYSLAILLDEFMKEQGREVGIQLFATDLSEKAVDKARVGIYPESIVAEVSQERLDTYFEHKDHGYRVRRRIRDHCVFARQDITKDPPFSHLDLISCCNVLIYLGPVLQKRVIPLFHYALEKDGILVLGAAESIGPFPELFDALDRKNRVYVRKMSAGHAIPQLAGPADRSPAAVVPAGLAPVGDRALLDLQREADRLLLTQYAPAGVLVDESLKILHFRGRTEPFLEPPSGTAEFDLMGMVRKGLWEHVRLAVQKAKAERVPVVQEGLRVRSRGEVREVCLRVLPVGVPPEPPRGLLVLFETIGVDAPRAEEPAISAEDRTDELKRLELELVSTRHHLQSVIENHQAASEELLSANEELQSTNEEMETAKEELQSANEELMTLNDELRTRNIELSEAYSDLNNVLVSANIPLIMLTADKTIRRITPMAQKVLNLIPSDVGRALRDIRLNVEIDGLEAMVEEVLESLTAREQQVQDASGTRYLLRIRPYRSLDEQVGGVVLAFLDIEESRRTADRVEALRRDAAANSAAAETGRRLLDMIEGMSDAFFATDREWKLTLVNREGARVLGQAQDALIGKSLWEAWPATAVPQHARELRRVLGEDVNVTLELNLSEDARTYRLRAHPAAGGVALYLMNVTDRREVDRLAGRASELEKSNVRLERFAHVVAHDLQEPLRTIASYCKLLGSRFKGRLEQDGDDFLGFIEGGVGRMQVLLRDLLAYSRVDLARQQFTEVDCAKVMQDVLLDLHAALAESQGTVAFDPLPLVKGDATQIAQVFRNLVGNALKFVEDRPPRVQVRAAREKMEWVFEVEDNGIGIAAQDLDPIFLLFKRLHAAEDYPGTGLGLAITRRIVERHGGRIWATSTPGQGSSFFFTLPALLGPA